MPYGCLGYSECERFVVDLGHRGRRAFGALDHDPLAEALRSADIDVAPVEIGHELSKRTGIEGDLVARADDLVKLPTPLRDKAATSSRWTMSLRSRGAHDDGDVDRSGRSSRRARSGVMPTPAPMRTTRSEVRA